jgi:DtxR family transcriptional regulator, Mn-dependent transcriptional regulator
VTAAALTRDEPKRRFPVIENDGPFTLTKSERETLKSVYRLTIDESVAHTGGLADALGVSPGTATTAVKRLAERGLVAYTPYHGVELTDEGRVAAVAAIRRHRIVERFLSDMLGYAWNEADRLAGSFEHDLPQEVEDRIYRALDRPATCPHGFPIPDDKTAHMPTMPPLYALEPGDVAVVAVPGSTDPQVIEFLDTLGVRPGVSVQVKEKHPFDGPLVLVVDGLDRTLSAKVANAVFVQRAGRVAKLRARPLDGGEAPASQGNGADTSDNGASVTPD